MAANDKANTDKVASLQRHLEKTRAQLTTVNSRTKGSPEAFKAWVELEIKRTEDKIAKLRE